MIVDKNGKPIAEKICYTCNIGMFFQQFKYTQNLSSSLITQYCEKIKEKPGWVEKFSKMYDIDYKTIELCNRCHDNNCCWNKFKTLNDFFTRKRNNLPPTTKDSNIIVSPVDGYCIYTKNNTFDIWIKGKNFSIGSLYFNNSMYVFLKNILIFRLSPKHYHRFHSPVYGKLRQMIKYGESTYSVNPTIVNSEVNVFNENIRIVLEIETKSGAVMYFAAIGATCVGSIVITHPGILKIMQRIKYITDKQFTHVIFKRNKPSLLLNEELGYFQLGGSCICMSYTGKLNQTKLTNFISGNSIRKIEVELEVGDVLFTI